MTDGTTCPPPEAGRKSTLTGLFVTIFLAAFSAQGLNTLVQNRVELDGLMADGLRLVITLAVIIVAITFLRLYRRRPMTPSKGGQ